MDKKKVLIIGIGNCGSQVANLAEYKYSAIFDTVCINTSESDLSQVSSNSVKLKIGKKEEVEGSGKDREKMKEYLDRDLQALVDDDRFVPVMENKKYVFIVVSAAGGTGSGAGPMLMEILKSLYPSTNFILVGVLPQVNTSLMEAGNAKEFLSEIYELMDESTTYMIYDNETTADLGSTVGLTTVNENIVEDIRVLTGADNYSTPYESIDDADMENIITTPGRLLVVRINKGLTEKNMEDADVSDMIIKAIKQSCHAETDRNKRVIRWGIITYFTEAVNTIYRNNFDKLESFIGTPVEKYNHNAINRNKEEDLNFMYFIASGLSPINDRATKIKDRIDKLVSALATDETSKYIMSGESTSYSVVEERKKLNKAKKASEDVDVNPIINKFRKK